MCCHLHTADQAHKPSLWIPWPPQMFSLRGESAVLTGYRCPLQWTCQRSPTNAARKWESTAVLVQASQRAPQLRHLLLRMNFSGFYEGHGRVKKEDGVDSDGM